MPQRFHFPPLKYFMDVFSTTGKGKLVWCLERYLERLHDDLYLVFKNVLLPTIWKQETVSTSVARVALGLTWMDGLFSQLEYKSVSISRDSPCYFKFSQFAACIVFVLVQLSLLTKLKQVIFVLHYNHCFSFLFYFFFKVDSW